MNRVRYVIIDGEPYNVHNPDALEAAQRKMVEQQLDALPTIQLERELFEKNPLVGHPDGGWLKRR